MENPQEFLDKNLEELKALQIDEVKVIDNIRLKSIIGNYGCLECLFNKISCYGIGKNCLDKPDGFAIVEVDENGLIL